MAISELVEVAARVADLERRMSGFARHGTVSEIDTAKARVRLNLGESTGGGEFLSPWVPYAQVAGALRAHIPPTVGQQFTLLAPSGDWAQAVALPMTWSNDNPSPSEAADENVITFGDVTITLASGGIKVAAGGVSLELTGGGLALTGGEVTHDGKNIGRTHKHDGVEPGGGKTGWPE